MRHRTPLQDVLQACNEESPLLNEQAASELRQAHCALLCHEGVALNKVHEMTKDAALRIGLKAGEMAKQCIDDPERMAALQAGLDDPAVERVQALHKIQNDCLNYVKTAEAGDTELPWPLLY